MSGLRLDTRTAALAGANSGPVIVPGHGAESRLAQVVAGSGKLIMPPAGQKLSPEEVATVRVWIDQGAQWPDTYIVQPTTKSKAPPWSFTPIKGTPPPAIRDDSLGAQWR